MPPNKPQFQKRNQRPYRQVDTLEPRQRILIVCEGKETEKNYFENFRVSGLKVKVIGTGESNERLVDSAIHYKNQDEYDQAWCVFDKDNCSSQQFENAMRQAKDNDMEVAYSNQSFELWFVLHIEDLTSPTEKENYIRKLTRFLGRKYDKSDPRLYETFLPHLETAIQRAERLLQCYQPSRPWHDDPSTRVHELVRVLRQQAKPLR